MKLKRIQLDENGQIETVWILTPEQYHGLVNHAINDLMMRGVIQALDLSPEEAKEIQEEALKETQRNFLETIDSKDMSQA